MTTTLNIDRSELEVIIYSIGVTAAALSNVGLSPEHIQGNLESVIEDALDSLIVDRKEPENTTEPAQYGRLIGYIPKNIYNGNVYDLGGKLFSSKADVTDSLRDHGSALDYQPVAVYLKDEK